jgi:hypothetical protein
MTKLKYTTRSFTNANNKNNKNTNDFNDRSDRVPESPRKSARTKQKYSKFNDTQELLDNDNDPTISEGSSTITVIEHDGNNSNIIISITNYYINKFSIILIFKTSMKEDDD